MGGEMRSITNASEGIRYRHFEIGNMRIIQ